LIGAGDTLFTNPAIVIVTINIVETPAGGRGGRMGHKLHCINFFSVSHRTVSHYSRKYWVKLIAMKSKKNTNSNQTDLVLTEVCNIVTW